MNHNTCYPRQIRLPRIVYATALLLGISWLASVNIAVGAPKSAPIPKIQSPAPWSHFVYVVSRKDGTVGCHRAGNGHLSKVTNEQGALPDPRSIYASRDRKRIFVGGVYENNKICAVTAFRMTRDGSLKETGYWFTYDAVPLSFWEPSTSRVLYVSTLNNILRYRSSEMTDLRKNPTIYVPPAGPKQSERKKVIALYAPDRLGKLVLKRSGAKSGEEANFDAAAASPGQYQLYYRGNLVSLSNTVYIVRAGTPSVAVCEIAKAPRILSQRQEIRLPDITPKESYVNAVVALHPDNKYLYVSTHRSGLNKIYQLAIRSDGSLLWRKDQTITIKNSLVTQITFSPDKKYIYILDEGGGYTGGRIHIFPINRDGSIKQAGGTFIDTVSCPEAMIVIEPR